MYTGNQPSQISSSPKIQTTPPEQRAATIRYLKTRLTIYPLDDKDKETEYNTIKQILHNNKFNPNIMDTFIEKQTTQKTKE